MIQLTSKQREDIRLKIQEDCGVYFFGEELDKMLEIVALEITSPKSFSKAIEQEEEPIVYEETGDEVTDAKNESIARSDQHANDEWKKEALRCVERVCTQKRTFTADDVVQELEKHEVKTHEMRAMGGIMKRAQKNGLCKPTQDFTTCNRKNCHSMPRRIWESCICK